MVIKPVGGMAKRSAAMQEVASPRAGKPSAAMSGPDDVVRPPNAGAALGHATPAGCR
jgi:hypothetical protein